MPSGRKLTERESDDILRLAGLEREDGAWRFSYSRIAADLGLHRCTVYRVIREAAVKHGKRIRWKSEDSV